MPRYENNQNLNDRSLLFYKNGLMGALPIDTMECLADDYDADFFSSIQTREKLIDRRIASGIDPKQAQRVNHTKIKRRLAQQAGAALRTGSDVVLDSSYNSQGTRLGVQKVVWGTGAFTVALLVKTPRAVACERVEQWIDGGELVVPPSKWDKHPSKISQGMKGMPEIAARPGEADFILPIDGEGDTVEILNQIEEQLIYRGLAETD